MSEPVSNAQVEDVLASIRKLVSHDKRPARDPETEPTTARTRSAEPTDAQDSKFVLAPAFRVAEDPDALGVTDEQIDIVRPIHEDPADAERMNEEQRADADFDAVELERGLEEQALLMSEQMEDAPADDLDLGTHMDVEDAPATFDELEQVVVDIKDAADDAGAGQDTEPTDAAEEEDDAVSAAEPPLETAAIAFEHRSWGELAGSRLDDLAEESATAVETDHTLASWYGQQGDSEDDETATSWDFMSAQPQDTMSEMIDAAGAERDEQDNVGQVSATEETPEITEEEHVEIHADAAFASDPTADLQAKIAALEAVISKQDAQLQTAFGVGPAQIELDQDIVSGEEPADVGSELPSEGLDAVASDADAPEFDEEIAVEDTAGLNAHQTPAVAETFETAPGSQADNAVVESVDLADADAELRVAPEVELEHVEEPAPEPAEVVQLSPAMAVTPDGVELDQSETVADHAVGTNDVAPDEQVLDAAAETLSGEPDVLDEEVLRDLVSEIVRQELQGALGERITRNVRKLVRREIHRAMATQDLD
ncbi:MAG: hypothetical protein AAF754_17290 [Pseudomonadota bacterium]